MFFLFSSRFTCKIMPMHNGNSNRMNFSRNSHYWIVHNSRTRHAQRNVMPHAVLDVACDPEYRLTKDAVNSKTKKLLATKNHVVYQVSVWPHRRRNSFSRLDIDIECSILEYCNHWPKINQKTCSDAKEAVNKYYYNMYARRCEVFTTNCAPVENEFELIQECLTNCTGLTEFGRELQEARGTSWKWTKSQMNVLNMNYENLMLCLIFRWHLLLVSID